MSVIFKNITAVTMDDESPVLEGACVVVEGSKIKYVGQTAPEGLEGEIIDGTGKVLMPGFVNAHTHLPMTLLRGYSDDCDLQVWLNEYIFPIENKLDGEAVSVGTRLGLLESIASGTTSVSDMYFFCEEIAQACIDAGVKANICRGVTCFGGEYDPKTHAPTINTHELADQYHGFDDGRIRIDACIHAEYTSFDKVWQSIGGIALDRGLLMHLHLSETKSEHIECIRKYGITPTEALDRAGVFRTPALAAHCVWLEDRDIELLASRGVSAVHCPVSNLKLASGVARVPEMLKAGINVALGTDGAASNNSLDMFEELKLSCILHKAQAMNPVSVVALDALRMATVGGAAAQGRLGECGRIAEGYDADLIMLDFDRPHLAPCHNVISNIVYSAHGSDVIMNMVRGKIIYRNGEYLTIDRERVLFELRSYVHPRVFEK